MTDTTTTSWEIATRSSRRKGYTSKILGTNFLDKQSSSSSSLSSKEHYIELKRLSIALSRHIQELAYCNALCTSLYTIIQDSISKDLDIRPDILIECIGLGRIIGSASNSNSVVQLSILMLINRIATIVTKDSTLNYNHLFEEYKELERLNTWSSTDEAISIDMIQSKQSVFVYDPVLSESDIHALSILGFIATKTPWNGPKEFENKKVMMKKKNITTLLFMPHCPIRLYSIALRNFWGQDLDNLILIGNTMGEQDTSTLGKSDCVQLLLHYAAKGKRDDKDNVIDDNSSLLTINTISLENLVTRHTIGDLCHIFGPSLSSTSIHTFKVHSSLGEKPPEIPFSSSIEEE